MHRQCILRICCSWQKNKKIVHEYVLLGNLIFILFWNHRLAVSLPSKDYFYDVTFQQFLKSSFTLLFLRSLPELCCILKPIFSYLILKTSKVFLEECIDMPNFAILYGIKSTHRPVLHLVFKGIVITSYKVLVSLNYEEALKLQTENIQKRTCKSEGRLNFTLCSQKGNSVFFT